MQCRVLAVVTLMALAATSHSQDFPNKPLRLVIAQPAGGPTDSVGRLIGQMLSEGIGQNVIIENRVGAGGIIGTAHVAKSRNDGYTLLVSSPGIMSIAPFLYATPGYDSIADFAHISLLLKTATVLVVHPSVPARTVGELVKLAKARPGVMNMASGGNGTFSHLTGELFKRSAGINVMHVPYKGSAIAATETMGGQVEMFFMILNEGMGHVNSGRVRGLATTGSKRAKLMPNMPTMVESGLKDFVAETWYGVSMPKGPPSALVARLHSALIQPMQQPAWEERFYKTSLETVGTSPAEFTAHIEAEIRKWGSVVKQAGIKIN